MKKFLKSLLIGGLILSSITITLFNPQFSNEFYNNLKDDQFNLHTSQNKTFIVGTLDGPTDLDPVHALDSASTGVIYQVAEGLFMHDLSDPELKIVPILAANYGVWDITRMHYTIPLRQGVTFHDGTNFNASSVKWNFERINWFLNATGDINTTRTKCQFLWKLPNGSLILDQMNPVTINNEYSITINLAGSYTILESLLCYVNAYILSPASTPKNTVINTTSGDLVGTGPFVYDYYIADNEVRFHRWDSYWRETAFLDEMIFVIIDDSYTRSNALLNGSIHYLIGYYSGLLPTFRDDPEIIVEENKVSSLGYYYI
ncbi:MAG: ABC transporter substrate-binding protein, partial [Candidatus Hermodarchaeota archaeon]